jgi:hypothetical protein
MKRPRSQLALGTALEHIRLVSYAILLYVLILEIFASIFEEIDVIYNLYASSIAISVCLSGLIHVIIMDLEDVGCSYGVSIVSLFQIVRVSINVILRISIQEVTCSKMDRDQQQTYNTCINHVAQYIYNTVDRSAICRVDTVANPAFTKECQLTSDAEKAGFYIIVLLLVSIFIFLHVLVFIYSRTIFTYRDANFKHSLIGTPPPINK